MFNMWNVLFLFSDNGPWLIRHLEGGSAGLLYEGKTTTWEGGVREPGIVHWPGHVQAGRISQEVVATYDIFPTIMKASVSEICCEQFKTFWRF